MEQAPAATPFQTELRFREAAFSEVRRLPEFSGLDRPAGPLSDPKVLEGPWLAHCAPGFPYSNFKGSLPTLALVPSFLLALFRCVFHGAVPAVPGAVPITIAYGWYRDLPNQALCSVEITVRGVAK